MPVSPAPQRPSDAPSRMGRFSVERRLGRGGMATVYLGKDPEGRPVAIKAMLPQLAAEGSFLERFVREVEATRLLRHRNVVQILAAGEQDGLPYLVTEYIEGGSLETLLEECPKLAAPLALEIAAQLFEGLGHAHAQGIVHRDLKPANLLLSTHGVLKVADFGVAKLAGASSLTRTGALFGTPAYMSPEQTQGQHVDARSDLFSAGMILYELLSGTNPHRTEDPSAALLLAQLGTPPIAETEPTVTPPVEHIVDKLLEREPEQRYQNAEQVLTALRPLVDEVRARHPEILAEGLLDPAGVSRRLRAEQAEAFRAKARLLMGEELALPASLWLHRAVLLDPSNEAAQKLFAEVCEREKLAFAPPKDPKITELEAQLAQAKDGSKLLVQLAQLHRAEGNPHRAVACLKRALRQRPADAVVAAQLTELTGDRFQIKVTPARIGQNLDQKLHPSRKTRHPPRPAPSASTPPSGSLATPHASRPVPPAQKLAALPLTDAGPRPPWATKRAAAIALLVLVLGWAVWRVGNMIQRAAAREGTAAALSPDELARQRAREARAELDTARGFFAKGDYSASIAACDALLSRHPESAAVTDATLVRARALLLSERNQEALDALARLLPALRGSRGPALAEALLRTGEAHLKLGDPTSAIVTLDELLRVQPEGALAAEASVLRGTARAALEKLAPKQ